jgi:hypothetical protein
MSDLSIDTKKHTMKSRETIPLTRQRVKFVFGLIMITYKLNILNCIHDSVTD